MSAVLIGWRGAVVRPYASAMVPHYAPGAGAVPAVGLYVVLPSYALLKQWLPVLGPKWLLPHVQCILNVIAGTEEINERRNGIRRRSYVTVNGIGECPAIASLERRTTVCCTF